MDEASESRLGSPSASLSGEESARYPAAAARFPLFRRIATAVLAVVTIVIAVIFAAWLFEIGAGDPSRRFIEAYASERRQVDLRFPGASYQVVGALRPPDAGYDFALADLMNYEDDLKKQLKARPGDSETLFALAEICLVRLQPLQAIDILERLRLFSPKDPRILGALAYGNYLRARASGETRDLLRSADLFEEALEASPDDPVLLFNAGTVARRARLFQRARERYERFLEVEPDSEWSGEVKLRLRELRLQAE